MDSYDTEKVSTLVKNGYRSKVKVHQHKVKIRMLSFKEASREVNGRPRIHLSRVVFPAPILGEKRKRKYKFNKK